MPSKSVVTPFAAEHPDDALPRNGSDMQFSRPRPSYPCVVTIHGAPAPLSDNWLADARPRPSYWT